MTWALGIAATQSSGLREMFGTMVKPMHPGNAARNGMLAAFLAAKDFTSSNQGIEAPRGFAHVLSTEFKPGEITDRLGETWEIALNTYKPFACGIVEHPIIDGCIQLRNEHKLAAEDIESVSLEVHPLVLELTGKKTPQTGLEAKFSVYHSAAVAVIHGAGGEAQYSDAVVRDPRVIALRDKVAAAVQQGIHEDQVRIAIKLKNGKTVEKYIEHAVGSLARPMSDADLEAKFRGQAEGILSKPETDQLIGVCWEIGKLKDAGAAARASVPTSKTLTQTSRPSTMKQPKRSTSKSSSKGAGKNPMKSREDPQGIHGKTNREDIRKEARRVNVPRQSKRPTERSR
jgi:2-methylcitrate dehydratase PrpD